MQLALLINLLVLLNLSVLGVVILVKTGSFLANRLLSLIIICPAVFYLRNTFFLWSPDKVSLYLIYIAQFVIILQPPLIYAYFRLMLKEKKWWNTSIMALTVIAILYLIYYALYTTCFYTDKAQQILIKSILDFHLVPIFAISFGMVGLSHIITFGTLFLWIWNIKTTFQHHSYCDKERSNFVFQFISFYVAYLLFNIFLHLFLSEKSIVYFIDPIFGIAQYIYIYYKIVQHPFLFIDDVEYQITSEGRVTPVRKEEAELNMIYQSLIQYMSSEKPYLTPGISLKSLAADLNVRSHKLSLAINQKSGGNFFHLINKYRVDEALILLSQCDAEKSIEDIAFQSGFNSRAAFYTAFKKHLHKTPSDYLEEIKGEMNLQLTEHE